MKLNRLQTIGVGCAAVALFAMHGYLVEKDLAARAEPTTVEQLADARAALALRMVEQQCGDRAEAVMTGRGLRCVNDAGDGTLVARVPGGAQ